MRFFKRTSSNNIDPSDREQTLTYLEKLMRLTAEQETTGEQYNRVLITLGGSIIDSPTDAAVAAAAAETMRDSALAIRTEHSALGPVPPAAAETFLAWEVVWLDYHAWTVAQAAAIRGLADGKSPRTDEVQRRFAQTELTQKKAQQIEGKLMKGMRLTAAEAQRMVRSATS
jgi:hypothetical protein